MLRGKISFVFRRARIYLTATSGRLSSLSLKHVLQVVNMDSIGFYNLLMLSFTLPCVISSPLINLQKRLKNVLAITPPMG
jgi:hypothetical protein